LCYIYKTYFTLIQHLSGGVPYAVAPPKGLAHIKFDQRPDSAASVWVTTPDKYNKINNMHTPANPRVSATAGGDGPYNPHQAVPGGFTRPNSVFCNVL
jgi:hypothetical protein